MARRRMIDPNFWQSEDVAKLSVRQRLLLIGLFSNADDEGKLRGNPAFIRSITFPYEDFTLSEISGDLDKIESIGSIEQYTVDHSKYIRLVNWRKFQRVDKPQASVIPDPTNDSRNDSWNDSQNDSCLKEGKGNEVKGEDKLSEAKEPSAPADRESVKSYLHNLVNQASLRNPYNLSNLDNLFSYIGMVDVEVIEAAIKKAFNKDHFNYIINTLNGMIKDGITKKEQLYAKPEPGQAPSNVAPFPRARSGKPNVPIVENEDGEEISPEELERLLLLAQKVQGS